MTKYRSRGRTHDLLPASCRHVGTDNQLNVDQWGRHGGAPAPIYTRNPWSGVPVSEKEVSVLQRKGVIKMNPEQLP